MGIGDVVRKAVATAKDIAPSTPDVVGKYGNKDVTEAIAELLGSETGFVTSYFPHQTVIPPEEGTIAELLESAGERIDANRTFGVRAYKGDIDGQTVVDITVGGYGKQAGIIIVPIDQAA